MWSSSNFKLTWNLLIMSIVGRLYGFKVITRTFLDFASNSVYIWCTYTSNSQDPFPKFDLTTHKIPLQFWWSSFWLDQSLFLVSVSLQVFRLILILWDSQQAIVTQFETMILWWLSSSVHKMILWNIYIYIYIYIYIGHEIPCASMFIMPRSHRHGQEGCTRCASTCRRYTTRSRHWHCWALELCSGSSHKVSAAGAGSKLILASSRGGEFSTGSLFGLAHCASCSTCLHSSQPSAKGEISQKQDMYHINHMFSTY